MDRKLADRQNSGKVAVSTSESKKVTSVIPQDSVLEPLKFNIYFLDFQNA